MHLLDNINRTMRCAEGALKNGNTVIICPKSDQKLKAVCLIKNKAENDTKDPDDIVNCEIIPGKETGLKVQGTYYCNHVHRDWNLTIGESLGTIIAKIERNDKRFTMHYRYYIKDIYEWAYHYEAYDPYGLSNILHSAHEAKVAQEYLIQGYFEGYLSWDLGDMITERAVADQIFTTLADKEGGLGNVQSVIWQKSNEIERIKESLAMEW